MFDAASAVVSVSARTTVRNLTIENTSSIGGFSTGLLGSGSSRDTVIQNLKIRVEGVGASNHAGVMALNCSWTLKDCDVRVSGAIQDNIAYQASTNGVPAPPTPLMIRCSFEGRGGAQGIALNLPLTDADVRDSVIKATSTAVLVLSFGTTTLLNCRVESDGAVMTQQNSASVHSMTSQFIGNNPIGSGSMFKYVHCAKDDFSPIVNGFGSSVQ